MAIILDTPINGASFQEGTSSIDFVLHDLSETYDVEIAIALSPPGAWTYLDSGGPVDYTFTKNSPIANGLWYWQARYGDGSGVTETRTFTVGPVATSDGATSDGVKLSDLTSVSSASDRTTGDGAKFSDTSNSTAIFNAIAGSRII